MDLHQHCNHSHFDPKTSIPIVGLLYTSGDHFAQKRIEMLVGPMLLENIIPVRFSHDQIDPEGDKIFGQWHVSGTWESCPGVIPNSILDLTIPRHPRLPHEHALLNSIPHTCRIDLDRFELLELLREETSLGDLVIACRPLNSPEDVINAVESWGPLILKSRLEGSEDEPLILEQLHNGWQCTSFFNTFEIDRNEFTRWLSQFLNGNWMIQPYLQTSTAHGRAYSLQITVQKRHDGVWMAPIVHCFMANESPFACLNSGAEHLGNPFIPLWADTVFPASIKNPFSFSTLIQCFANIVACRLESLFSPLTALGFKILIDKDMNPRLANITVRPAAPAKAARNLEFFKHISRLMRCLPVQNTPLSNLPIAVPKINAVTDIPLCGISVRSAVRNDSVPDITDCGSPWLDVAISNGGRYLLSVVSERNELLNDTSPLFLSIRLGTAAHDYAIPGAFDKLNPVEEYVGRGLILWPEVNYMRSVRVPLLQAQLDFALLCLNMRGPDMVWIDDLDLGLSSLSKSQKMSELVRTVEWLDGLCNQGVIRCWGIKCFNAKNPGLLKWIEFMADSAARHRHFKAVCLRFDHYSEKYSLLARKHQLSMVLLVKNQDEKERATQDHPGVSILVQWNPDGNMTC